MLMQTETNSVPRTATGAGSIGVTTGVTTVGQVSTLPNNWLQGSGYYCNQCGTWVSGGMYHLCGMSNPNAGSTGYTYYWPNHKDAEILEELKSIRRLIEGKQYAELAKRVESLEKRASTVDNTYPGWQQP